MSGGALPDGMSAAVGSGATPTELAAGAGPSAGLPGAGGLSATAPQMTSSQLAMNGLLGALTGNAQYGTNAPAIHQAITSLMQPQGARAAGAAQGGQRRPGGSVAPITSYTGMTPSTGSVTPPNFQQGSMQGAVQSLAPWLMGNGQR